MPRDLKPLRGRGSRHDALGTAIWHVHIREILFEKLDFFQGDGSSRELKNLLDIMLTAAICHHGAPKFCDAQSWSKETYQGDPVADRALELFEVAADCAGLPILPPLEGSRHRREWKLASWWVSGLVVLADWIGSNQNFFPYFDELIGYEEYWRDHALPRAEEAVRKSGVLAPNVIEQPGFQDLFPTISDLRPMQSQSIKLPLGNGPECLILEDVTGVGKTEAALMLASRLVGEGQAEGIYFALPTMATANAMYDRLASCYRSLAGTDGESSLSLAHGASRLNEGYLNSVTDMETADSSASCTSWLAQGNKRALLAPISVGTIDQALLGVLPNRHQNLRLHGLADKVLIVDEVHACDEYVLMLLGALLAQHAEAGGSVILLSATLPQSTRQKLVDSWANGSPAMASHESPHVEEAAYPLLTQCNGKVFREIPVACPKEQYRSLPVALVSSEERMMDELVAVSESGGCAAWVRNTVGGAIDAWKRLSTRLPVDRQPILFHARFALGDRFDLERQVLETFGKDSTERERRGRILIATQVVEQSLDLDFDVLASDLAPIDLLIQRAGRCMRHRRDVNGNRAESEQRTSCRILMYGPDPDDPEAFSCFLKNEGRGLSYVYPDHHHLWRGARLLVQRGRIAMPDDARILVESVYDENIAEPALEFLQRAAEVSSGNNAAMRCLAANNTIRFRSGYIPKSAAAWGDDEYTPTRLGDPTIRLRIARWDGEHLEPWCVDKIHPWEFSEVAIRWSLFGDWDPSEESLRIAAIEHIKEHNGLHGRALLPLVWDHEDQAWAASVSIGERQSRRFSYDAKKGLTWD